MSRTAESGFRDEAALTPESTSDECGHVQDSSRIGVLT
jgi:hypothetical protein